MSHYCKPATDNQSVLKFAKEAKGPHRSMDTAGDLCQMLLKSDPNTEQLRIEVLAHVPNSGT